MNLPVRPDPILPNESRTTFLPSRHGFAFPNRWEDETFAIRAGGRRFVVGLRGRCGGMAFTALDLHHEGRMAAELAGPELPDRDSALASRIWRRQLESLLGGSAANMRRFAAWTLLPTGTVAGVAALTRRRELGRILTAMVAGRPVPLGLLTSDRLGGVGLNHQVVVWRVVREAEHLDIGIYDPNHPGRDDVALRVSWRGEAPVEQFVGGVARNTWRGLFVERYRPRPF